MWYVLGLCALAVIPVVIVGMLQDDPGIGRNGGARGLGDQVGNGGGVCAG